MTLYGVESNFFLIVIFRCNDAFEVVGGSFFFVIFVSSFSSVVFIAVSGVVGLILLSALARKRANSNGIFFSSRDQS